MKPGISYSISLSLEIINLKVILRKLLGPADLTRTQALHIYELTDLTMVSKNKDLSFAIFPVVVPSLKSFNNG